MKIDYAHFEKSVALDATGHLAPVLRGQRTPKASAPLRPRQNDRRGPYRLFGKRLFDLAVVLVSAPFTVPLILGLAAMVALDGGRPFYRQRRVGRNGREFLMWKLRSMVPDADARLQAHLDADPAARAEWDSTQKLRNDPRVTRFGAWLRRSSMDELPQLWNVFRGHMSLVGPRPMMPCQRALYPGEAYYALQPGITGFWQVSERNDTTFEARADYDADYLDRMSLATDLRTLLQTVRVVLRCTGV